MVGPGSGSEVLCSVTAWCWFLPWASSAAAWAGVAGTLLLPLVEGRCLLGLVLSWWWEVEVVGRSVVAGRISPTHEGRGAPPEATEGVAVSRRSEVGAAATGKGDGHKLPLGEIEGRLFWSSETLLLTGKHSCFSRGNKGTLRNC